MNSVSKPALRKHLTKRGAYIYMHIGVPTSKIHGINTFCVTYETYAN